MVPKCVWVVVTHFIHFNDKKERIVAIMFFCWVTPRQRYSTQPHFNFFLKRQGSEHQTKGKHKTLDKITNPRWKCSSSVIMLFWKTLSHPYSSFFPTHFLAPHVLTVRNKFGISKMLAVTRNKTKTFPVFHRCYKVLFSTRLGGWGIQYKCDRAASASPLRPLSTFQIHCLYCQDDNNCVEMTNF